MNHITKPYFLQTMLMVGMTFVVIGAVSAPQQPPDPVITHPRHATAAEEQAWEARQLSAELDRIAAQREAAASQR